MNIQTITNEYLNELYHRAFLESGLEVIIVPKKDFVKKYAFFAVHYGGIHNQFYIGDDELVKMPAGIAHFLEHQVFEDADKNTFSAFEELGASVNAYTSSYATVYHCDVVKYPEEAIKTLMSFVQALNINEKSVQKELGVIEQEIKMYEDEPTWRLNRELMRGLLNKHPLRDEIAGTVDSIQQIDADKVLTCYNAFYTPANMKMIIYGDVDAQEMIALVDSLQTEAYKNRNKTARKVEFTEPHPIHTKRSVIYGDVHKNRFELGFKHIKPIMGNHYDYMAAIKTALDLVFGRGSQLYKAAYEQNLVQSQFEYDVQVEKNLSYIVISNDTDEIEAVEQLIFNTIRSFKANGFDPNDFERIKRKMIGRVLSSMNSLNTIASNFTYQLTKNKDFYIQIEAYKNVKYDYMVEVFNYFFEDMDNHSMAILLKNELKE
ncbi:EF-P 5-aminopentanol modification-associated protein YfmH [Fusibacter sp. 3D3]|uniref:EF-P 5-aminopentanol modification-associated protein YfmH n=1 Tax=Fusibacter sp. 3D3 TaxID=1048380 RepID=UPI000852A776|nr:pitrilysin family protein [Fusibacter sp. 3D3]GAU78682.1 peptidase [Fusibacter sp. 3D3]